MNTSPHDAAASSRFNQRLSTILWLSLLAEWEEQECFYIQADIEYEAVKAADISRTMGKPQ